METSASLVNAIVDNARFHFNSHINQMLPHISHILHFCPIAPYFVVNTELRSRLFNGRNPESSQVSENTNNPVN